MHADERSVASRWAAAAMSAMLLAVAVYYAGSTLFAVWHYGWSEMFADQFWQYTKLIEQPFPMSIMLPDSQHRQVMSHLLRLADIRYGGGDQVIGVIAGLAAMIALLSALCVVIWRQREWTVLVRAAITTLATAALMWMGSARMQFHGNEAFQVYAIMGCAVLAILAIERLRARARSRYLVFALIAATVAAMTFASGIAVFGLVVVMLWLRRMPARWLLGSVAASLLLVLAYTVLLPVATASRMVSLSPGPIAKNTRPGSVRRGSMRLAFADAGIAGVDADLMARERLGAPWSRRRDGCPLGQHRGWRWRQ
jgi:hypothetical protein